MQYVWTSLGNSKDRPDLMDSVLIAEFDCKTTEEHTELCEKCVLGAARWCPPISTRNRRPASRRVRYNIMQYPTLMTFVPGDREGEIYKESQDATALANHAMDLRRCAFSTIARGSRRDVL